MHVLLPTSSNPEGVAVFPCSLKDIQKVSSIRASVKDRSEIEGKKKQFLQTLQSLVERFSKNQEGGVPLLDIEKELKITDENKEISIIKSFEKQLISGLK